MRISDGSSDGCSSELAVLGLDENDFLRCCKGTFKLGIEVVDWSGPGSRYLHTFSDAGINLGNVHIHHYWRRHAMNGGKERLWDYSLHQLAVDEGRFGKLEMVGNTQTIGRA